MTEPSSLTYFGEVDASEEDIDQLNNQFVEDNVFQNLIGPSNRQGVQIVVAVKGAGKTALGRVLARRFDGVTWVRTGQSAAFRFDVPAAPPKSGLLKNSLRVFLLEQLSEHLLREGLIEQTEFETIRGGVTKFVKKIAKGTKVKAPFVEFDPSKLFDTGANRDLDAAWLAVCDTLTTALGDRRCLLVLDDIDDYFLGIETQPRFIEALCRAAQDINVEPNLGVSCVVLMKQGIWRAWFQKPEEYDKVKQKIDFLRWDRLRCAKVLGNRVAVKHNLAPPDISRFEDLLPTLRLEFAGIGKEIETCINLIYRYSINGPRDIIDLCNKIRKKNPTAKITDEAVKEATGQYSDEKLNGIHADYGNIYPEMPYFLQKIFDGHTYSMKGEELATWIEKVMVDAAKAKEPLSITRWFKDSTAKQLVKVLFDIGVVGVVKASGQVVFSIETESFSQNQLMSAELSVHPAYRSALGLAD